MAIRMIEGQPGEGMTMDTITENVMAELKTKKVSHAKPGNPKTVKEAGERITKTAAAKKAKATSPKVQEQKALPLGATPAPSELVMMPLSRIQTHKQVRTEFPDESLRELATDIAARGVLQPILLRPNPGMLDFLVIAGERRFRAAQLAGLENIPAIVGEVDGDGAEEMQLAENIQREDLSLKDTAAAIRKIYERCQSVTETAAKVRKSKAWVSKHLAASCPNLRTMAREILEGGFSEDLEIILILDKMQAFAWSACQDLCQRIKKGEVGRQTVRDEYEAAKEKAAEEGRRNDEANTPEKRAEIEAKRKEQEEAWRLAREKAEDERKHNPQWLCGEVYFNIGRKEENRTTFTEKQNAILGDHLRQISESAAAANDGDALAEIIRMTERGDSCIEVAAYVLGIQQGLFDLDYLVKQVSVTIESED